MQTTKPNRNRATSHLSLSFLFQLTSLTLITLLASPIKSSHETANPVRIIRDKMGEDLFATFAKINSNSSKQMGLRKKKKNIGDSFVKMDKGSSAEDELTHFLNMDKEDTPKLLLESFGATKVGVNVSEKSGSVGTRQKKGYVYAGQKRMGLRKKNKGDNQDKVLQESIKEWLGKELFKHTQKISRSNSLKENDLDFSRMEVNSEFQKSRTKKKIVIDSQDKSESLEEFKSEMKDRLGLSALHLKV